MTREEANADGPDLTELLATDMLNDFLQALADDALARTPAAAGCGITLDREDRPLTVAMRSTSRSPSAKASFSGESRFSAPGGMGVGGDGQRERRVGAVRQRVAGVGAPPLLVGHVRHQYFFGLAQGLQARPVIEAVLLLVQLAGASALASASQNRTSSCKNCEPN